MHPNGNSDEKHEAFDKLEGAPPSPSDCSIDKTTPPVTLVTIPPPVQDGGTRAWLQVLGSFLVFCNLWGFTFAFGSFQSYYELTYLRDESPSDISWIGTLSAFLLICVGIISGPLFDLGYFQVMLLTGACVETLGVFLLSLSSSYYQILLTQGVMIGLGNGLLYLPGLALVGRSFKKHRSIAMSFVTCGAPVGGIVFTVMFQQLIDTLGFAWTVRAQAFLMLGAYLLAFPLLLWRAHNLGDLASGTARKLFDRTAFTDLPFWAYSMSNFFLFVGYMVPFTYMAVYGQTQLGMSQSMSLNVIIIAQAASVLGRLVTGYTASKVGVMLPWSLCGLISGIMCLAWNGVHSEASFIALMTLYGFSSGGLIPLPPSAFPRVCTDPRVLGARLGMAQGIGSVASLIGSPIAGALVGVAGGGYLGLQLFSGLVMILGASGVIFLWTLLVKRGDSGKYV